MKIVINNGINGFDVSNAVYDFLIQEKKWVAVNLPENDDEFNDLDADIFILGPDEYDFVVPDIKNISFRKHPDLVEAIETLTTQSYSDTGACPIVVNIPNNYIDDPVIVEVETGREFVVDRKHLIG